jgi:hydrogenase maturation protein HypF
MAPVAGKALARVKQAASPVAYRVRVRGVVQGVGFRPFVYRLAVEEGLSGWVANTNQGVEAFLQGEPEAAARFRERFQGELPPAASVAECAFEEEAPRSLSEEFHIRKSEPEGEKRSFLTPDMAVCRACMEEVLAAGDRRRRYPFTNCTHCGPRYTILEDVPYDRPRTTMKDFSMCPACRKEYEDPLDRRFHAQPNACPVCGPALEVLDEAGSPVSAEDPLERCREILREGRIVAVMGLGGVHLAADSRREEAVRRLRERKQRKEKPFALMARGVEAVEKFARVSPEEERLLRSPAAPIVLLAKKTPNGIARSVAPRQSTFGAMLPYTPLHHLLLAPPEEVLVMTSGNESDEPLCYTKEEALGRLSGLADAFLLHDRPIAVPNEDSVVRSERGRTLFVRRSRGHAPLPIRADVRRRVLALGGDLKNTLCLTRPGEAVLSHHLGTIESTASLERLEKGVAHLQKVLGVSPGIAACDLHPDYFTSRWAEERYAGRLVRVQHHHAHLASVMAEHRLEGDVLGALFDGAGYGTDGAVWGGEFFAGDFSAFRRLGHFEYIPMPGGDAASREPLRMAAAYLYAAFGDEWKKILPHLPDAFHDPRIKVWIKMVEERVNSPLTSSAGRLFDAVASLVDLRHRMSYEGQAAMELEALCAGEGEAPPYEFEMREGRLSFLPTIREIVSERASGVPAPRVAACFHATLAEASARFLESLRGETGLDRVVLGGGVFQNVRLLGGLRGALEAKGFEVFVLEQVPPNDGGLALGQALIADRAEQLPCA